MILIHLSDTHFGTEMLPVQTALIDLLNQSPPDLILLTGDITQRATPAQFAMAARFIQQLPQCPLLAVPGNHDISSHNLWERFIQPYAAFNAVFGSELEPSFENEQLLLVCVNSTRRYRQKDGEINATQIDAVEARLRATPNDKLKILATHHPFDVVLRRDHKNRIHNAHEALKRWASVGLDLVMGGHIHYPFFAPLHGRYHTLTRQVWIAQAGTAISRRIRDGKPNSFNRLVVGTTLAETRLERWDYIEKHGFYKAAVEIPWR